VNRSEVVSLLRTICLVLVALVATALAVIISVLVWEIKCSAPSGNAARVLVPIVKMTMTRRLAMKGSDGDTDAELRALYASVPQIKEYRIVIKPDSGDVVVEPTGWCFCRQTFILQDGGKRVQRISPLLSFQE
jgi:hypothetical protein